jgi:protein-S-isoprenylcysteine O-methyltransferase Ste14
MIFDDPYLLVRAASVYVAVMSTAVVWIWRRPTAAAIGGAALASAWNLPMLLALHLAAVHFGWWHFEAQGGLLLGMPVDLYLSWVWLWGAVLALACPTLPLAAVLLIALTADLVLMPAAAPVVRLGPLWILGELVGLIVVLLPGQLLARWTSRRERLVGRAFLQMVAFSGLLVFVLPAIAIEGSGGTWRNPTAFSVWQLGLLTQALAVPALFGLTAVQEFVTRGGGTPVPFDAPRRLVSSGVYAYVRNPMQLSAVVLLVVLGLVVGNVWVAAAGVMAHLYSVGLATWDEDDDLAGRFGEDWIAYRRGVRAWLPRIRPWHRTDRPAARLFVATSCGVCREVARWFAQHQARHLAIVPAESHPGTLRRITYDPGDGTREASGIEAIARGLEHIHLGWAILGWFLRLPGVGQVAQLLADASGGELRSVAAPAFCPVGDAEIEKQPVV